uniref:Uncharacterized protein n=1 Tax=Paramormyrops kingsleyae TaxID=1676925 RepID=A0A3B3RFS1_9TELE
KSEEQLHRQERTAEYRTQTILIFLWCVHLRVRFGDSFPAESAPKQGRKNEFRLQLTPINADEKQLQFQADLQIPHLKESKCLTSDSKPHLPIST